MENMPRANCGGFSCVGGVRIHQGITSLGVIAGGLIREAHAYWLREIEHITALVPGVGVELGLEIFRDITGTMLLEQANQ